MHQLLNRIKKIVKKIVKDKQLLTIFILFIVVIIVGCFTIGFIKTFGILICIIAISFLINYISNRLNDKSTIKKVEKKKLEIDDNMENDKDIEINEKISNYINESSDEHIMKKNIKGKRKKNLKKAVRKSTNKEIKRKRKIKTIISTIMYALFVFILYYILGFGSRFIKVLVLFSIMYSILGFLFVTISKKDNPKAFNITINVILIGILLCIILGVIFIGYVAVSAPKFNPSNLYRKESSIVYSSNETVVAKLGSEIRDTITFDDMPQVLVDAIIATEDSRFFQHNGVDWPRFMKAAVGQLLGNSSAGGGSTITMQVSKNAYTSPVRNGIEGIIRKFTDIYLSMFKIEQQYTKEQILEYYVNIPGLGSNSFGVAEAANTYFGKNISDLNLSEAALLAGLFQAPTAYNPYNHPDAAAERRAIVLRLMKRHGYITKEEEEMANAISVESLLSVKQYSNPYQSFIDVVIDEIYDKTGENPYNTPMKIYTTMDVDKQNVMNDVITGKTYTWPNDKVQVGIAATNVETGGIVALSGGRNTVALGLNRATDLNNQPGSTAKPLFDYGPGVEYNNWSTYTPFIDEAHSYSNGVGIKNWDDSFYGFMTLKRSLGLSRNIPALKAFQNVDNNLIKKFVTSLGIRTENENGMVHEAHALGSFNGTSPLEMASAYAAFANGGYYIEPYTINKIVYMDTNETKEYKPTKVKVMADSTAYIITNTLIWAVDSGLSAGERIYGRQVAAKTGTSNFDYQTMDAYGLPYSATKDYWVAGYTPKVSMALWYGYDRITEGYNTLADNARKDKIYNTIMKGMLEDTPTSFKVPSSVTAVQIESGTIPAMLPSENTPKELILTEYFKTGTEPTSISPRFQQLNNPNTLNVEIENKKATLTWKQVNIPAYYTEEFMDTYIKSGIGDSVESYKKYRLEEVEKLGAFGYDIYVANASGTESYIMTTTETSATIDVSKYSGDIKFIVRTSWANDKSTASSGSEYTMSVNTPLSLVTVTLLGNPIFSIDLNSTYIDQGVTVLDNFVDVTSEAIIKTTITDSNNNIIEEKDIKNITKKADTYRIKYKVTYKNTTYEKERIVKVA